uniref:Cytochrome P450 n=1 Tax=Phanerodontia chrysosporium TaxID=2822231 RepID=G5EJQ0_PHACH|nr:cytochrome P450 [Phanerodontia chrysosporium]
MALLQLAQDAFRRSHPASVMGWAAVACYALYHKYLNKPVHPLYHFCLLLVVPAALLALLQAIHRISVAQECGYALFYWLVMASATVVYRISPFHPLANYPGPLAAKISKLYLAYLTAKGRAHEDVRALHSKYGDVVRIGPNELSFNRSDAIQTIYADKTMPKGPYYVARTNLAGVVQLDGVRDFKEHARRRRPWNKAMNSAAIKSYEPIVSSTASQPLGELSRRIHNDVNISDWMSFYGFDFMGRMVFGREWGMLKEGRDVNDYWHTMDKCLTIVSWSSQIPWSVPIIRLMKPPPEVLKMQKISDDSATARLTSEGSRVKDLYYYLLNEDDSSKSELTRDECISEGVVAIVAGSDTAATALTHLCYYLLTHPDSLKKLRQEIEEAYPTLGSELDDLSRQAEMPYLNACINETLRLLPPVLTGLQRSVTAGSGAIIAGYFVPEGVDVSVHHYSVHRNSQDFSPIPDTFWPDRWLDQDAYVLPNGDVIGKGEVRTNRGAFMPFSVGPQQCAGKNLAMVELRAVACGLFRRFDLSLSERMNICDYEKGLRDAYTTVRGPLYVKLKPRKE